MKLGGKIQRFCNQNIRLNDLSATLLASICPFLFKIVGVDVALAGHTVELTVGLLVPKLKTLIISET